VVSIQLVAFIVVIRESSSTTASSEAVIKSDQDLDS
jgi:hypothetical protein